jgi:hypothetical protein
MEFLSNLFLWVVTIFLSFAFVFAIYRLSNKYAGTHFGPNVDKEFEFLEAPAVNQLRVAGSDMSAAHEIEFFLYFPNESCAKKIQHDLVGQNFEVKIDKAALGARLPWVLKATKLMLPDIKTLAKLRVSLTRLADSHGGFYDGWASAVVPQLTDLILKE